MFSQYLNRAMDSREPVEPSQGIRARRVHSLSATLWHLIEVHPIDRHMPPSLAPGSLGLGRRCGQAVGELRGFLTFLSITRAR